MTRPAAFASPSNPSLILQSSPNDDPLGQYQLGDVIGSFLGFLRRPKATRHGLTAQVFGENGNDADFIAALHLTRYLDAPVKVSVWMVKDKNGRLFNEKGEQPLLTEFIGRIRRPQSSDLGQTALFFGENGPNADAINVLNQSGYQDALVLVGLQKAIPGMLAADISTLAPHEELEAGKERLTAEEASKLKKHQKRAEQAQLLLRQNGFFSQMPILKAMGTAEDYREWLCSQTCCHPQPGQGPCQQGPVQPLDVLVNRLGPYGAVPFCTEHYEAWMSETPPDMGPQGGQAFLSSQALMFVQRWAQDSLRKKLKVPVGFSASPNLIFAWAADHQLRAYLPAGFNALMETEN